MDTNADRNAGWLVAAVCVAGPALVSLIPMAAAPALVAMAKHFNQSAADPLFSQFVMTLPAAMLVVSAPLAGIIAQAVGQRAVLLASLFLYILGGLGALAVDRWEYLIALRLLLGVAGGGLLTSSLGLIGDHFSGKLRERILGYATSVSSLLAAAALVYGGRLVDLGGWQAPFIFHFLAVPTLLVAALTVRNAQGTADVRGREGRLSEIIHVWPYYILLVLLTMGMFTPAIQVSFVLAAKGIGSAETAGAIIASTSFVATISAWAFGSFRRWIGLHGFLGIDALSMGAGIFLIGVADSLGMIFAGCALVGIGAGMSEPATAALIFRRTAPHAHALAMGLIVSALNAGQFINPILFSPIRSSLGASGAFVLLGLVLGVAGLFVAFVNRKDLIERRDSVN